jgi:hypothetical protein
MDFGLFDETVMVSLHESGADADAAAWQQSNLSSKQILARGGPREVAACCQFAVDISAGGSSTTRVTFRFDSPMFLNIHAEILDLDDYRPLATLYTSGNVDFSLTGPNLAIVHEAKTGMIVGEPLPAVVPIVIEQTWLVDAGIYELDVLADYAFRGDRTLAAGYYDVRLTATPIPEPCTVALLILALVVGAFRWRYVVAHFGK